MPRIEMILQREGEAPFVFWPGRRDLEPGELASLYVAAIQLLRHEGAERWWIFTRDLPDSQPEQERDP